MPATWGYGGVGTQGATIATWGYATNLEGIGPATLTEPPTVQFSANKPAVQFSANKPAIRFTAKKPTVTFVA